MPEKVETHVFGGKSVPSGFFFLPDAQHVSAVLFSNSGTVSKFNRMGQQGLYHHPDVRIIRNGICYNPDPDASAPYKFTYEVGDPNFIESWGQGLEMFHNPIAVNPVDRSLFPDIAHHRFENGMVYTEAPDFHPISSITGVNDLFVFNAPTRLNNRSNTRLVRHIYRVAKRKKRITHHQTIFDFPLAGF